MLLQCNFSLNDALRKYIRYALNERAFNPVLVADLIHLRKVSNLTDAEVAEVLNDVSRRIVKAKGILDPHLWLSILQCNNFLSECCHSAKLHQSFPVSHVAPVQFVITLMQWLWKLPEHPTL
jgi:hypothetical protein